ncbi:hypothetical protein [Micromonospora sp. NPDC048063]|uniref:hypothetical protein n=1 Tax=Micromonospora sp. NPDC048063 TaxID=3364256 RepID=UPI003713BC02
MTPDPTMPLPPSEPPTQPHPTTDPWASAPVSAGHQAPPAAPPHLAPPLPGPDSAPPAQPYSAPPAAAQYSAPPAQPYSAPPAQPYSAPPAQPYSVPPAAGQYSAPPAQPYSAPPAQPYSVPPAAGQYSAPPAQPYAASPGTDLVRPGPHPPVMAPAVGQPGPLPAGYPPPAQGAVAVQIGEIMVSPPVIHTPAGVLPLAGASWHVVDHWQQEQKTATWAVVCAIVGFFCLTIFSLLFLLIKETRHHGTVQITVSNGAQQYVARMPVANQAQVQHINNQVNYARSLSNM